MSTISPPPAPSSYVRLVEEGEHGPPGASNGANGEHGPPGATNGAKVEEGFWRSSLYATDALLGSWFILCGCVAYSYGAFIPLARICCVPTPADSCERSIPFLTASGAPARFWFEFGASLVFDVGAVFLVIGSYPSRILAQLARPALPQSFVERWCTSSAMLLGVQIFCVGMLPYLVEGCLLIAADPRDILGYEMVLGTPPTIACFLMWASTMTDENLRKNRGRGTAFLWERLIGPWAVANLGEERAGALRRHMETDQLALLWFFVLVLVLALPILMWVIALDAPWDPLFPDEVLLAYLGAGGFFAAGLGLHLRAAYPENFLRSIFDGERDRSLGDAPNGNAGP